MKHRIIALCRNGGDREDGTVMYSKYLLVSSETLKFDEPIFEEQEMEPGEFNADDEDPEYGIMSKQKIIDHIKSLGYEVSNPYMTILWAGRFD